MTAPGSWTGSGSRCSGEPSPERTFGTMSVVVLGMHRSGTSAATRVISLLGVPLCQPADLLCTHHGNDPGHWESAPLVAENERLLGSLTSSWWCPPRNTDEVAGLASDATRVRASRTIFSGSFPTPQWVWKDPRTCLLLPFWRQALPMKAGEPAATSVQGFIDRVTALSVAGKAA